ncbi:alpha/beta hydrolase [Jiella sp. MQZ9-1]|uniref:Alpha/beta hydrolase n=1 Tax=Jiella flava TaxID=2816857 RepID=A0A939FXP3_9HYPH|nr:alpha/beta hydrolase [Jiella flava]MBO0662065.1 alpha/beta hydrolase [Jiella flava]MCD2470607.1 alpha/beta hydrolase [Jiella flava]
MSRIAAPGRFVRRLAMLLVCGFYSFALSGCAAALNAITPSNDYTLVSNVSYGPGARRALDLYLPKTMTATTPVVVFIHGGSWDSGSKDIYPFVGESLASAGMIVAIPNYRLYPDVRFPGFVDDAAKAVATVNHIAAEGWDGLPKGRHPLFVMGHSAGAEIAGLLATDGRWLQKAGLSIHRLAGFIGLSGPYDFLPLKEERYKQIFPKALRAESQPINFVNGDEPPTLLITGADDVTVDPKNSRSLAAKLKRVGVPVTLTIYPGLGHVGTISSFSTVLPLGNRAIRQDVIDFVRRRSG